MENISIQTSQNVLLEESIASLGERVVAHLIDYSFFFAYFILINLLPISISENYILWMLVSLPILFYDLLFELIMDGQNPGKKIMKIKVVRLDGAAPSIGDYLIRWLFRIIDNVFLFGLISSLTISIRGKGQRIGDILAGTAIIRIRKPLKTESTGTIIPPDYHPQFEAAANLSDQDVRILQELMEFLDKEGYGSTAAGMTIKAKKKIEDKLGIKSDLKPADFLRIIIRDYYALIFRERVDKQKPTPK